MLVLRTAIAVDLLISDAFSNGRGKSQQVAAANPAATVMSTSPGREINWRGDGPYL